ncbi:MAG: TolC family protein [Sandaracinaceae bacterium]|nr:TolC family protein [Sandaracinaceae bacterium]
MRQATGLLLTLTLLHALRAEAQVQRLSLPRAVERSLGGPGREAGEADAEALRAGTDAARWALAPSLSVSGQLVREAANVAPGASWGNEGIPAISGPPFEYRFDGGIWITQVGAGLSYDVLGLIRRVRLLDASLADEAHAREARRLGQLDRAADTAAAFLGLRGAERARAALADAIARSNEIERTLAEGDERGRLVMAAERRALEARVRAAAQVERAARARLSSMVRLESVTVDPWLATERGGDVEPSASQHPAVRAADAGVRASSARAAASRLELLPRVELLGALWARGSGLQYPGRTDLGDATGLAPDRPGWALGLLVTWRLLDVPAVEARARVADARVRGDRARREAALWQLRGQLREARLYYRAARENAAARAEALEAAVGAYERMVALRQEGTASVSDVLAMHRAFTEAAVDHALAPVALEQAVLVVARASGDLEPFLEAYRRRGAQRVSAPPPLPSAP